MALEEKMAAKYLEAMECFTRLKRNLAIFSASYRIQNSLMEYGLKEIVQNSGKRFFMETPGISGESSRRILEQFKMCAATAEKAVLCGPMGGRFAEGADYPGKELEGIFLAGIPFEKMGARTRMYLDYYSMLYGKGTGRYLGYVVPALRRASQALGRALRSAEDTAVFFLGDWRYGEETGRQFLNAKLFHWPLLLK